MTEVYVVIERERTTHSKPLFRSLWRTKAGAVTEAHRLARAYAQRSQGQRGPGQWTLRVEEVKAGALVYVKLSSNSGAFDVHATYAAERHEIQGSAIDALAEITHP